MKSIQIEDDIFEEIDKRTGMGTFTHSEVIRKLLGINSYSIASKPNNTMQTPEVPVEPPKGKFALLINSPGFKVQRNAIDRYLTVLSWLYMDQPGKFQKMVEEYRRGDRLYFAQSQEMILARGKGIKAKQIPNSPYWALETLDNPAKRNILRDVLKYHELPAGEINLVLDCIPDSPRHKPNWADEIKAFAKQLENTPSADQ